jgi:hypothetical protein
MVIEKPLYRYTSLDSGMLCRLFRSEDVYVPSSDDFTKVEMLQNFIDNALQSPVIYVLGRNPKHEAYIFAPSHNAVTYQAHFAVRKDKRDGTTARRAAEAGKWIFQNTDCRSIIAFMRHDNKPARVVLAQIGMKKCGEIKRSVKFNGEYDDELVYQATIDDYNALWGDELGEV